MEKQILNIDFKSNIVIYDKFTFILERFSDKLIISLDSYIFNNEEFRLSDRDDLDIELFYNEFLPYYNDVITIQYEVGFPFPINSIILNVGVVCGRNSVYYNYIENRILLNDNVLRNDNLFKNKDFYIVFENESEINLK